MKTAHVCFLWHMHQPYYTDPVLGSASMPWVRLHATKAYFDMAFVLDRFPHVHATFNFTPSLLVQLKEIGDGTVKDLFLEHAQRRAAELSQEEQAFLIRHFFSINWATMIRPYPRYYELLVKRGLDIDGHDLQRLARQFTTQDLLDLQVWFNLAWFGYGAVQRYPRLAALRTKSRGFSEEEKQEVLTLQRQIVQDIVPMYRRLAERGQIELSTTPFYHPILPLIIDTDHTRRARPDLPLPSRFRAPEDAEAQVRLAVEYHAETFGKQPVGLWPSEGSVCPELIPLLHRVGLKWLATDEGVLARSLEASQQAWHRQSQLYRPYTVGPAGEEMSIVFRDRDLSDGFGFLYHKTTADVAAEDVLRRIKQTAINTPQDDVLLAIILDGENPWEHYPEGGEQFLSHLYTALSDSALDDGASLRVRTATMSEALAASADRPRLSHLHSGSWINQDFKIWIGHAEDNRGWDLLNHTRSRLLEISPILTPERRNAAWHELYAAEGSDWFWWYGDDFDTAYKEEFDRLFRTHLRNVWTLASMAPPDLLNQPICEVRRFQGRDQIAQPVSLLRPTLDGLVTDFFEWRGAGTINPNPPLGAMWKADGLFSDIRFGFDYEHLYLRLDPDNSLHDRQADVHIDCWVQTPADTYRLGFSLASQDHYLLLQRREDTGWREINRSTRIAVNEVIELALSFKDIQAEEGHALQMTLIVHANGLEIARYPRHHPVALTVPGGNFEATVWRV
ncbi:MAG TPA: glycoside hydrolase family 57 protein [Nitrospira sp.]|nr:glycoside hydrolase family 57 protein [Nitrospira sp.]